MPKSVSCVTQADRLFDLRSSGFSRFWGNCALFELQTRLVARRIGDVFESPEWFEIVAFITTASIFDSCWNMISDSKFCMRSDSWLLTCLTNQTFQISLLSFRSLATNTILSHLMSKARTQTSNPRSRVSKRCSFALPEMLRRESALSFTCRKHFGE